LCLKIDMRLGGVIRPVVPALGRLRQEERLSPKVQDQSGQHGETPQLKTKKKKSLGV
jgi:hypothetical protein